MQVTPCQPKTLEDLKRAPVLITNHIDIHCSAGHLFDIFEDEHAWTIWGSSLDKVIWTSPKPFGLGTTRRVMMSGGIEGVEEFIAWETGKRMAFYFTESSMPNMEAFGEDYVIEKISPTSVRLTWHAAFWPSNRMAMMSFKVLKPVMRLFLASFLKNLKTLAEGSYQPKAANPVVAS